MKSAIIKFVKLLAKMIGRLDQNISLRHPITVIDPSITKSEKYWLGYYDLNIWSRDSQYILVNRICSKELLVAKMNIKTGDIEELCTTKSWSFQLAARAQFLSTGSVIVNKSSGTAIIDCKSHRAIGEFHGDYYYSISNDEKFISFVNYDQILKTRPGYGFRYDSECKYLLRILQLEGDDYEKNREVVNLDVHDVVKICHAKGICIDNVEDLYLNHPQFSPDQKRVAFVVSDFGARRVQYLLVLDIKSHQTWLCPAEHCSHFCWIGNDKISVFCSREGMSHAFCEWDMVAELINPMAGNWPSSDGHQSLNPQCKSLWVVDSYPDIFAKSNLYVLTPDEKLAIARVHCPMGMGPQKLDLHPRWNPDGEMLAIDLVAGKQRSFLLLDLSEFLQSRYLDGVVV